MPKNESASISVGPPFYENWKKSLMGDKSDMTYEVPLFTDARFTHTLKEGYGPYQFLNISSPHDNTMRAALILRVNGTLTHESKNELKTNEQHYHGGWLADEAAAIISLCCGVRLKAGNISRTFGADDPKGSPVGWGERKPTLNINDPNHLIVPSTSDNQRSLQALSFIRNLPSLPPEAAGVLIRAARLYQDALWVCESEPQLSWLLMVSAVETAANYWQSGAETPVEKLRDLHPELEPLLLQAGGPELLEAVATEITPHMGATRKFRDFLMEFLPPPPQMRPEEWAQHSWDKEPIKKTLNRVYSYRSRALHDGTPFQAPMYWAPMLVGETYEEKPSGLASGTSAHKWMAKDTPICFHTFEYIVRGALLKWWASLVPQFVTLDG